MDAVAECLESASGLIAASAADGSTNLMWQGDNRTWWACCRVEVQLRCWMMTPQRPVIAGLPARRWICRGGSRGL